MGPRWFGLLVHRWVSRFMVSPSFRSLPYSVYTSENLKKPINTSFEDAFWGPSYWAEYDPTSSSSSSSPDWLEIDTHQYYAFAPLVDLPHTTILESVCNVSRLLKSTDRSKVPSTIVGEWSLQTGESWWSCFQGYSMGG